MLEDNQQRVLEYLQDHFKVNPRPPSYREISQALGLGLGTVRGALDCLEARGLIERVPGGMRSIILTAKAK